MKKVLFPIMALILMVCLVPVLAAPAAATWTGNLLENPSAETGDMTPWTHSDYVGAVTEQPESCGRVLPNSGDYFFNMAMDAITWFEESMEQEIDLSGLGGTPTTFEAGGWVQTELWWPSGPDPGVYDYGTLIVEFLDSGDGSLGEVTLDPVEHPVCGSSEYAEFYLTGAVPGGAAKAVYRLVGHRVQSTWINVFYDDLYFRVDVAPACTDADNDGYSIEGGQCGPVDCDDSNPNINPEATEVCDGKDNDCDGNIDEGGVCGPVGGTILPTDKSGLAMPWIMAASLIVVAGVSLAVWNKKRGAERASDR